MAQRLRKTIPFAAPRASSATLHGIGQLVQHGFMPIVTVAQTSENGNVEGLAARFVALLRRGYARPRLKVLPMLRIGAEVQRGRGYSSDERVTPDMMKGFDRSQLLCHQSRIVTDRGVYVCPILIEADDARLGTELGDALGPCVLRHQACYTCYQHGALCSNPSGGPRWLNTRGSRYLAASTVTTWPSQPPLGTPPVEGPRHVTALGIWGRSGRIRIAFSHCCSKAARTACRATTITRSGTNWPTASAVTPTRADNAFARLSYAYTLENTSQENRRWLRTLPAERRLSLGKYRVLLCHGSPDGPTSFCGNRRPPLNSWSIWRTAMTPTSSWRPTPGSNGAAVCPRTGIS